MDIENVIIVGSGPAGYTAALYTSRANLKPLLIEGEADQSKRTDLPGGQLMITTEVENYPGFPDGVQGPELMTLFRRQAERFGTRIVGGWVERVDFRERPFRLWAGDQEYRARAVILATGAGAKWLGLPSEKALLNRGVSACATCDGALPIFRNKPVAVIGGGDTALEEATFLTRFASKVTVIHRRDQLRASKIMQEKARKNPKIDFLWDTVVTEILDVKAGRVTGLRLENVKTHKVSTFECSGVFVAIGHQPNTQAFQGQVDLDDKGYVKVSRGTYTSVEGVFAAGDCVDHVYRQAVTAAGMGCMAAIDCERWLESQDA
ncbi:MAG TPA: thioredoxin-disulfide reductase [Planctomycetota bacterium]|nr:thioredoxin-disulfide reductase [Planctomycetota bacterium]